MHVFAIHAAPLLGILSVDPALRGFLIVFAAVAILPGSVFMLLSTNVGARLGVLLALAGFFGWMTAQGVIWTIYAQGNRGQEPHWVTKEIVTGDLKESTMNVMAGFPQKWTKLKEGDKVLGDASAAADLSLSKTAQQDAATATGKELKPSHFEPPFGPTTDYVRVAVYDRGGEKWPSISNHIRVLTIHHKPHFVVVQVAPALAQTAAPGQAPPKPVADPSKPVTTVIMERDLGKVRFPPFMLALSSFVIFSVVVSVLHRRDKEAMAARAAVAAA